MQTTYRIISTDQSAEKRSLARMRSHLRSRQYGELEVPTMLLELLFLLTS